MMREISFESRGCRLRGFEHLPEQMFEAPVIVMCHGFTGNCEEHGLFPEFAETAAAQGYYVVRFDCAGSGKSEGEFAKMTSLGGWRDDIISALEFAAGRKGVDSSRMTTLGVSLGGAAALLASVDYRVVASVGWAPALYPDTVFRRIMTEKNWSRLKKGIRIHHEYAGSEFESDPVFQSDAESLSVEKAIRKSGKPVLVRLGTADEVIDPDFGPYLEGQELPNVKLVMVGGEDHGLMNHKDDTIRETMIFLNAVFQRGMVGDENSRMVSHVLDAITKP